MLKKLSYSLITVSYLLIYPVYAQPFKDGCKQVVIAAHQHWLPHVVMHDGDIQGVSVDLLGKIFAELDIPIELTTWDDPRKTLQSLSLGDIDLVASSYNTQSLKDIVTFLEPGYLQDPVTIVRRKAKGGALKNWNQLIGQHGVMTEQFAVDNQFDEYLQRYLYVTAGGSLRDILYQVRDKQADYALGSRLQLEYGLKTHGLHQSLELVSTIKQQSSVYVGIAKRSACFVYLPYIQKRLAQLKADGTVSKLIKSYIAAAPTVPAHKTVATVVEPIHQEDLEPLFKTGMINLG